MSDAATPKAAKKNKKAGSNVRGWTPCNNGYQVSRTITFDSAGDAAKAARRMMGAAQKAEKAVELGLDGAALTIRLPASGGRVDDTVKKLAKRLSPKRADKAAVADEGADEA